MSPSQVPAELAEAMIFLPRVPDRPHSEEITKITQTTEVKSPAEIISRQRGETDIEVAPLPHCFYPGGVRSWDLTVVHVENSSSKPVLVLVLL